ncbi:MAG: methionine--tRNA ligase, partial [Rhizobiaceae bacterium]|nr:methionine--tRNA ligase [Rhizobiaceae bacterium]
MTDKKQFYITTAISYPNGKPHIGQAYELIATDAIARFKRLDGFDVFFLTGTDEHGQKMIKTAAEAGMTARELADKNVLVFRKMTEVLNASNDDFIRTTEERHYKACQAIWKKMVENDDIYLDRYAGWYSIRDEAYYDERETEIRDDEVRYGPQGTPVEWVEEESFFFKLSAYEDKLLELYKTQSDFIGPSSRRNEIVNFVKGGLRDLSISRTTFDWGVPVPGNPDHVMYVWVDALTNYLTATGWPDGGNREHFWPADVHVIGKDITRFHMVYWPAFLLSAGLPLPKRVFGHGFVMNRGIKMSKSIGNVVDPFTLVETYGVDQIRFFFLREIPFGNDGNYSDEAIINRINADLANDFGNLAQRSLSMINKNCEGRVPAPGEFNDADKALLDQAYAVLPASREFIDQQLIHKYLDQLWQVVGEANRYFASQEPWALKKTDPERMNT